jgi:hypothetical protein
MHTTRSNSQELNIKPIIFLRFGLVLRINGAYIPKDKDIHQTIFVMEISHSFLEKNQNFHNYSDELHSSNVKKKLT